LTNITDADGDIISDLKYMPSLVQVSIGFKGSVSFKEFISNIPNVTTLTMSGNKKTYYDGTLANMLVMRNLTSMTSLDWKTTYPVYTDGIGYEFDIEDIGKILPDSITTFRTSNGMTVGPLESFVAGLRTNRTTGSMSIYIVNAQYTGWRLITFQGNIIPTSSSAHTLSWTASTITFDGTTIDA
jgi:Leucine-rich repeat (LRR) protein